jgi:hypothetical protein
MIKQVFITYRQESRLHAAAVLRLGKLLREANIEVALDQFYLDEHPGGPDSGGWTKWCEDCATDSACVLIIASEGWFSAYKKTAPSSEGLGAATEADLIRQLIYDKQGRNTHIRLVFLHEVAVRKVPVRLRTWQSFQPFASADERDRLIRWVGDCVGLKNLQSPTVGWPKPRAFRPDLANRLRREWPAVVELLAGRSRTRILLYQGDSGFGKSELLRQAALYAGALKIPVVRVNFKGGGLDANDILGQFGLDVGQYLPTFTREGASDVYSLRADLRALRQPILAIFDAYEDCADNVADWLSQQVFVEVELSLGLGVIVAGKTVPDCSNVGWRDLVSHLRLRPITEIKYWRPWVEMHYPDLEKRAHFRTVLMLAKGNPALVCRFCETIAESKIYR